MVSKIVLITFSLMASGSGMQDPNLVTHQMFDNLQMQVQTLNQQNAALDTALAELQAETDRKNQIQTEFYQSALQSTNTSISGAQAYLAAAGYTVAVCSAILVIFGIFISLLVLWTKNKVDQSLKDCQIIVKEAKDLKNYIDTNIDSHYERIRLAELDYILDRLIRVPEDIINFLERLASQDNIPSERYQKLKSAYLALPRPFPDYKAQVGYLLLFYAHFPAQSLFDPEVGSDIEQSYGNILDHVFDAEAESCSIVFFSEAAQRGFTSHQDRVRSYFGALYHRMRPGGRIDYFARSEAFHAGIYQSLSKDHQFDLCEILLAERFQSFAAPYFKLLLEDFGASTDDHTPAQLTIIKNIRAQAEDQPETEEKEISAPGVTEEVKQKKKKNPAVKTQKNPKKKK